MLKSSTEKVMYNVRDHLTRNCEESFVDFIEELKEVYKEAFVEELYGLVTDKDSLANPEYFFDDYAYSIDKFNYFSDGDISEKGFVVRIPTEDTFKFDGRLSMLALIVHGLARKYYELPQQDFDFLINESALDKPLKKTIKQLQGFFDESTPKELKFYLVPSTGSLYKTIQTVLNKKLVVFPFSNTSPIDIFQKGVDFFENGVEKVIATLIDKSIKDTV